MSTDGGLTYQPADEVRLIYDLPEDKEELHVTATHEGLVIDVCTDGEVTGSSSEMASDIADRLWTGPDKETT